MKTYKPLRLLRWFAINAAFAVAVFYALFRGVQWCDNLLVFVTWFTCATHTIVAFAPSAKTKAAKEGPSAPKWMGVAYDMALILTLAAQGRFLLASLWAWSACAEAYIYSRPDKDTP